MRVWPIFIVILLWFILMELQSIRGLLQAAAL